MTAIPSIPAIAKHLSTAANATQSVLSQAATFTKAWYLAQDGMTDSFWLYATVQGLAAKDYVPVDGDKVGRKGSRFLLTIGPAPAIGKRHKRANKQDDGAPYMFLPFGRDRYGRKYKAMLKAVAMADVATDTDTDTDK